MTSKVMSKLRTNVNNGNGTNKMNVAYDSDVTYITLRLLVFSKALSGISLIRFPSRNLKKKKKKTEELTIVFSLFNLLTNAT